MPEWLGPEKVKKPYLLPLTWSSQKAIKSRNSGRVLKTRRTRRTPSSITECTGAPDLRCLKKAIQLFGARAAIAPAGPKRAVSNHQLAYATSRCLAHVQRRKNNPRKATASMGYLASRCNRLSALEGTLLSGPKKTGGIHSLGTPWNPPEGFPKSPQSLSTP